MSDPQALGRREPEPDAEPFPVSETSDQLGSSAKTSEAPRQRDPVRRWTLIVLGLCVLVFFYTMVADRLTPYTPQAVVQAYVVGVAPEVSGRVVAVAVADNERVEPGQLHIEELTAVSGGPLDELHIFRREHDHVDVPPRARSDAATGPATRS